MVKITNDTNTLNGALSELGETLASNITSKGVTASASDGLTTLANKVLQITGGGGSTTLLEDNCTTDKTSDYNTNVRIGSTTNVATLTFDSTETAYYTSITTTNDAFYGWVLPNTRGETDIKITCKVKLTSTSAYNQFMIGVTDNIAQSSSSGTYDMWRIRGDNKSDYLHNYGNEVSGSSASTSVANNYVYIVFEKTGTTIIGTVYDENMTQLRTYTYSNANSYSNPYYFVALNTNQSANHCYIKSIKAETIGGGSDCSQYQTQIENAIEYINGDGT